MKIISEAFQENEMIPEKYTADGENINPPLELIDIPSKTKSTALIIVDPDAPNGDFVHWILFNIPPGITEIAENSIPEFAIQGTNSLGTNNYLGPSPPSGTHKYLFQIYTLDCKLKLDESARKDDIEKAIKNHIIEKAQLTGIYYRY